MGSISRNRNSYVLFFFILDVTCTCTCFHGYTPDQSRQQISMELKMNELFAVLNNDFDLSINYNSNNARSTYLPQAYKAIGFDCLFFYFRCLLSYFFYLQNNYLFFEQINKYVQI